MPFDYDDYEKKCNTLTTEQLHKEWENYTRQISGGATSTATSILFSPLTGGISLVGLGLSTPRIHNARKKREIIEAGLQSRGTTHNTRKRDVIAPMAVAGTLGGLTLGLAGPGADILAGAAVGHGVEYAATHVALDATGAALEHNHDVHSKKKADERLKLQYQRFQEQYLQDQAKLQGAPLHTNQVPGLQIIPPGPPHSSPGTAQFEQKLQPQSDILKPALEVPPPVPQHSRPGTPQGQPPQYQPREQIREKKDDYVSVPATYNDSIVFELEGNPVPSCPPVRQPETYHAAAPSLTSMAAPSSIPEKADLSPTYNIASTLSPYAYPVPQYWSQEHATESQSSLEPQSPVSTETVHAHPTHIDIPPAQLSMEEEILLLKARLIQLELEKRGATPDMSQPTAEITTQPTVTVAGNQEFQPSLTVTPPVLNQSQSTMSPQQYGPLPPASPALPPRSPNMLAQQLPPPPASPALPPRSPNMAAQRLPPPPASPALPPRSPNMTAQQLPPPPPLPQVQNSYPPPPPLNYSYTYQPQNYPKPPASPSSQQQAHFQRHDSGYYSNIPTPSTSNRLSQSFVTSPIGYSIPPQGTGISQHSHRSSTSSSYQPSPMSPAPPPYNQMNSAVPTGAGKDYFGQGAAPPSPHTVRTQDYQRQSVYGTQGWQWGAPPTAVQTQFPPPPPSSGR